jgi:hypothetical protein
LIKDLSNEANRVVDVLEKNNIQCDKTKTENELLYDFVKSSNLYHLLRANISKVSSLNDIQNVLGLDIETTIAFISLCTRAQKDGKSLIDARYHFFIRSLEGCFVALSPEKHLFLTRQKYCYSYNKPYAVFEVALCDECGKFAIVGKEEQDKHLVQGNKLDEKVAYYFLADEENNEIEEDDEENGKLEHYYLCPHCGAIVPEDQIKYLPCDCGKEDYIKVVKARVLSLGARCGNCHRGTYKRFYLGNDAATSVLQHPYMKNCQSLSMKEDESSEAEINNIFARVALSNQKKAKRTGRQFLAFSDSRQEAAKFACYLGKSYDEFLRRRGICQIINEQRENIIGSIFTISDFVKKLTAYFSNKRSFAESNSDNSNLTVVSNKNAWIAMLNELARYNSSTSLTSLGVCSLNTLETLKR